MMRNFVVAGLAGAAMTFSVAAYAADAPQDPPSDPYINTSVLYDWTGVFVGIHAATAGTTSR